MHNVRMGGACAIVESSGGLHAMHVWPNVHAMHKIMGGATVQCMHGGAMHVQCANRIHPAHSKRKLL